jgi:peptidoglycan/LPS O-acetylase OafA/YrhL
VLATVAVSVVTWRLIERPGQRIARRRAVGTAPSSSPGMAAAEIAQ